MRQSGAAVLSLQATLNAVPFYRKHGFVADGTARFEDGVREIRMVRSVQHGGVRDGR